jgi:hypothetical protein
MPDHTTRTTYEQTAYELGCEHARNSASWAIDGNTSQEHIARLLGMLDAGDPQVWDFLPIAPNLSGEYADDLTPNKLADDLFGHGWCPDFYAPEGEDAARMDALCDAYEEGVTDTFGFECERILRDALA